MGFDFVRKKLPCAKKVAFAPGFLFSSCLADPFNHAHKPDFRTKLSRLRNPRTFLEHQEEKPRFSQLKKTTHHEKIFIDFWIPIILYVPCFRSG